MLNMVFGSELQLCASVLFLSHMFAWLCQSDCSRGWWEYYVLQATCLVWCNGLLNKYPFSLQLSMFRLIPARTLSRAWGELACWKLPLFLRRPLLGFYVWAFSCRMEEAMVEDLQCYHSLMQLFTRRLKSGTRPISALHELVINHVTVSSVVWWFGCSETF